MTIWVYNRGLANDLLKLGLEVEWSSLERSLAVSKPGDIIYLGESEWSRITAANILESGRRLATCSCMKEIAEEAGFSPAILGHTSLLMGRLTKETIEEILVNGGNPMEYFVALKEEGGG